MELQRYISYQEYKKDLDAELGRTAEGFVRIGYLLKVARDTDVLKESGYTGVTQFAEAEYGLRPDQVTRFIRINDRFSKGGYAEGLEERFAGMGYTKLVEMLQLPDEVNEELTPGFTREDIKELRTEIEEENRITDIEVMLEGAEEPEDSLLHLLVRQLGHDSPKIYRKLHEAAGDLQEIKWALSPSGEMIHSIRIRGKGKFLVSVKEKENQIAVINVRSQEKEKYTWEEVGEAAGQILFQELSWEESWEKTYGEPLETEEPEEPKKETKKEKRVQNAAKEKRKAETETPGSKEKESGSEEKRKNIERKKKTGADRGEERDGAHKGDGEKAEAEDRKAVEGTAEAAGGKEDVIAPAQKTRKEYLDDLTEYGAALYISGQYRDGGLREVNLGSAEEIERWLQKTVDEKGEEETKNE